MHRLIYFGKAGAALRTIPLTSAHHIYMLARPMARPKGTTSVVVRPATNEAVELVVWQSKKPGRYALSTRPRH